MYGALDAALTKIPDKLRAPLLSELKELCENYALAKYRPAELNAGRFSEIVYNIVEGYANGGSYSDANKPNDMVGACRSLEKASVSVPRSMRITIPRLLPVLYEIRNNRNIGHVSSEIDPNYADATFVINGVKWIVVELVRVFNSGASVESAQKMVDEFVASLSVPLIWEIDGKKIVQSRSMTPKEKVLAVLKQSGGTRSRKELVADIKFSDPSHFKTRLIDPGEDELLWAYDDEIDKIKLSPIGQRRAEKIILEHADDLLDQ